MKKRLLSIMLAAATVAELFAGCAQEQGKSVDETVAAATAREAVAGGVHTLYFRDSAKSEKAVATFFNSLSGKSAEVEMEKTGADADAVTFSCEADTDVYNMAYVTCGESKTASFAFNPCVSGWYEAEGEVWPYTEGETTDDPLTLEELTLTGYGYEKRIYVWKPADYDAAADEKYAVIYVLDGQSLLPENGSDPIGIVSQVRAMTALTGTKAIVVGIDNTGMRDYELVPDIGVSWDEKRSGRDFEDEFDCMSGTELADFVADTLAPYIRQHYNVYADKLHTAVHGASLGGLEAFYIAMEHPELFGTAGAFSASFWEYDADTWTDYLGKKSFDADAPFLYFYAGPAEFDTGAEVTEMVDRLRAADYPADKLALHYDENGAHGAVFWRSVFSEFLTGMVCRRVTPLQSDN